MSRRRAKTPPYPGWPKTITSIRRVEPPAPASRRWCLAWRSACMPASAFWYFRTRREAVAAAEAMS